MEVRKIQGKFLYCGELWRKEVGFQWEKIIMLSMNCVGENASFPNISNSVPSDHIWNFCYLLLFHQISKLTAIMFLSIQSSVKYWVFWWIFQFWSSLSTIFSTMAQCFLWLTWDFSATIINVRPKFSIIYSHLLWPNKYGNIKLKANLKKFNMWIMDQCSNKLEKWEVNS